MQGSPCLCRWGWVLRFRRLLYPRANPPHQPPFLVDKHWVRCTRLPAPGLQVPNLTALGLPIFAICRPDRMLPWTRQLQVLAAHGRGAVPVLAGGATLICVSQLGFLRQNSWKCEAAVHWGCHCLLQQGASALSGRRLLHQPGCSPYHLVLLGRALV